MGARALHTVDYKAFCRLLRQWRDDAGLTQRALAERMGILHTLVHKLESGQRRMDPLELVEWCQACDVLFEDGMAEVRAVVEKGQSRR